MVITGPDGTVWRLSLRRSWYTPFNVVNRLRAASGMRHGPILDHEDPPWAWSRLDYPPAWLLVAEHDGRERLWICPGRTKAAARDGLNELAQHIQAGRSLASFGHDDPSDQRQ
jgi:hypothetical protein